MPATGDSARHDGAQQAILASLAQRLGPQKFNAWFKATTRFSLEDGHVKLSVPNPFVAGWIENHFMGELEQAVLAGTGGPMPLLISVDPSLCRQFRRRQLDIQAVQVARSTDGTGRRGHHDRQGDPPLRHSLKTFVVGPSNQLAYSTAVAVAAGEQQDFKSLFIHGGCGLGKTHLLQGICNAARGHTNGRARRWRYVSAEQFTNEFVSAIKAKQVAAFRETYRKLDLLAIDDVHFLAAKRATQEELLHTFNTIDLAGKQVVMTSDAHPKVVAKFSQQLVSRFVCGMVVKIDPPSLPTRVAILRRRVSAMRTAMPEEVLEYIAMHIRGNVRELEGALVKLAAVAALEEKPVTRQMATDALAEQLARTDSAVALGDIESTVAAYFGITPADLHSSRRTQTVSLARALAMTLARRHTPMSYPEIGRFMGKNHSSVILAVQRMERLLADDASCTWMTPVGRRSAPARELLEIAQAQLP